MIFAIFKAFFTIILMDSTLGQNDCYHHYISVIWEGPLCVTAQLTEIVQYYPCPLHRIGGVVQSVTKCHRSDYSNNSKL